MNGTDRRPVSLGNQISAVRREIEMRRMVYARRVAGGKMRESVAAFEVECMEAVLRTLQWLEANEDAIRDDVRARRP